jgi:hypothetical protein
LEEQLGPDDSCSISRILFIRKFRSEITITPSWGFVIWCEAGPDAGILLSAAACANICTAANNRIGTSNRIQLSFPLVLISMVSLHSSNFVPQVYILTFIGYAFYKTLAATATDLIWGIGTSGHRKKD